MTDLKYNYIPASPDNRDTHMWTVVGDRGAVHIWACLSPSYDGYGSKYFGGIEIHSKKQLYSFSPEPVEEKCWLHGERCWHDGSGLYFSEQIEPMIRYDETFESAVHEFMYSHLHSWYNSHLKDNDSNF